MKEITEIKDEMKDHNKDLVRVSKESKNKLNYAGILKKGSVDLEKRMKRLNEFLLKGVEF